MVESLKFTDNFFKSVRFLFAVQPLRAFRFLQYLSFMETIHLVVLKTFSDFLPLALILFVFLYIFTLFGMQLFNKLSNDEQIPLNFQDFFSGFSTCFSILTLDNWYTFVSAFMNMTNRLSMTFFTLTLFLFGNFVLLDLFIAAMLHGFEFICFKQNQIEDNENNFNPESKQPNIWNKFAALHSQNFKEERKKESLFGHKVFASIKRVSKYISLFSVYWTVKHRKIVKLMKKVLKSKFFNYVLYVVIWISCGEMIIESYYINYWNYENEMTGFIFVLNLNLNIFFLLEIFIKIYTEGLIDGTKEIIKNFIYLNELMIIFGFFTYFLFDEKNLILQVWLKI